jgi:AcrR family transcriptional regulator
MDENPSHETRDRKRTERRILDSAKSLIEEHGFESAGINAIAEKAGVNKVLIYRYFGGLDGLYQALAEDLDLGDLHYAGDLLEGLDFDEALEIQMAERLRRFQDRLRADELSQALMIWELHEENELTRAFAAARERVGVATTSALLEGLQSRDETAVQGDMEAALAIVSAAIYYLTLRARGVRLFNGIDIRSEEGWSRLCSAMSGMIAGFVGDAAPASMQEKSLDRAHPLGRRGPEQKSG